MGVSLTTDGIADGATTRLIVNGGAVKVAENQGANGGQLFHYPVSGLMPRAWGNLTPTLYATHTISSPAASGSYSWYAADNPGQPTNTFITVIGDASHMRLLYHVFVHCCRVSWKNLNAVSTYANYSFSSNATNNGPYTFSWNSLQFTGSSNPITIRWYALD